MPVIYKPRRLIPGEEIGQRAGTTWVGVPDKYSRKVIVVEYGGTKMKIKSWKDEARAFRRFRDKFWEVNRSRPRYYTLGYFKYTPEDK